MAMDRNYCRWNLFRSKVKMIVTKINNINSFPPVLFGEDGAGRAIYVGPGSHPIVNDSQMAPQNQSSDWFTNLWNDYGLYITIFGAGIIGWLLFFRKK